MGGGSGVKALEVVLGEGAWDVLFLIGEVVDMVEVFGVKVLCECELVLVFFYSSAVFFVYLVEGVVEVLEVLKAVGVVCGALKSAP